MNGTGIGTSLILIAVGAVLAIAVDYQVSGLDINAIGVILIAIGILGLVLSMLVLGAADGSRARTVYHDDPHVETQTTREVVRDADAPVTETRTTRTTRRI